MILGRIDTMTQMRTEILKNKNMLTYLCNLAQSMLNLFHDTTFEPVIGSLNRTPQKAEQIDLPTHDSLS